MGVLLSIQTNLWTLPAFCSVVIRGSFSRAKLLVHDADHLPSYTVKVKNEWSYTSASAYTFVVCTGTTWCTFQWELNLILYVYLFRYMLYASLLSDVHLLEKKMYKFSLNLRWVMAYVHTFWAPGRLNFVWWCVISVGLQYGTYFMPSFWHLEFWDRSYRVRIESFSYYKHL